MSALIAVLAIYLVAQGDPLRDAALLVWGVFVFAALADLALSPRRIGDIVLDAPQEVFVGETAHLGIDLSEPVTDIVGRVDWPDGLTGPVEFPFANDGETAIARITCLARRRGAWRLEKLWLRRPSRYGLFESVIKAEIDLTIRVVPNIRLVQSGQIATTVISTLYGVKENRAIGDGSEFHQLREFSRGMDVKSIDWKRSAKRRLLLAKELRAERNHHVIIAIDNGYLMSEEIAGLPKIDHAITAALATAWAAAIGGDLVGSYAYDARPRSFTAPELGRQAFARLRSWTSELSYLPRETNHTLAMSELKARTPKRSLIIIFTDFVDATSAELMVENISILGSRHLVIFVALRDPEMENRVATSPESLDGVAELVTANLMLRERKLVFEKLTRMGITVVDARPGEVTAQVISTYLDIKARELI